MLKAFSYSASQRLKLNGRFWPNTEDKPDLQSLPKCKNDLAIPTEIQNVHTVWLTSLIFRKLLYLLTKYLLQHYFLQQKKKKKRMSINTDKTVNITCGSMWGCGVKIVIWKKTFLQSSITYELCDTDGHLITQSLNCLIC